MANFEKNNNNTMPRRTIRSLAFHLLYSMDRLDYTVPFDKVIDKFKVGFDLDIPDDSAVIEIVQDVIAKRSEIDEQIKPLLKHWSIDRLGCCTLLILRMAIWELNQKETAPSIVINEAIELAKAFAERDAYKFVNGILDEFCKVNGLHEDEEGE